MDKPDWKAARGGFLKLMVEVEVHKRGRIPITAPPVILENALDEKIDESTGHYPPKEPQH